MIWAFSIGVRVRSWVSSSLSVMGDEPYWLKQVDDCLDYSGWVLGVEILLTQHIEIGVWGARFPALRGRL
jgi:hypothetical protein